MRLNISARQSDLARLQAQSVGALLASKNKNLQLSFLYKTSLGDQSADQPLWQAESKGVFTQDFYHDLISAQTDAVVHSWKDLPIEPRMGTDVVATLPREDSRDVLLITKETRQKKLASLRVLTSSPRRILASQNFLRECLPWTVEGLQFSFVRGNVPTRVEKLLRGDGDILIVAKAALDRLLSSTSAEFAHVRHGLRSHLERCDFQVLPLSQWPTAAAQGALAVEVAHTNAAVRSLMAGINHEQTFADVIYERKILQSYGGGCHQKIGISCLTRPYGRIIYLRGQTDSGLSLNQTRLETPISDHWPVLADLNAFFPLIAEREQLFRRQLKADPETQQNVGSVVAWWVAREFAVPKDFSDRHFRWIWTAGVQTWKALARRGFWVHGTADALGERETPGIDILAGQKIFWTKLTHSRSESDLYPSIATYDLLDKEDVAVNWSKKTHFFWMSGSQFLRAAQLDSTLSQRGYHAAGPGLTADFVRSHLSGAARFQIFLSYEQAVNLLKSSSYEKLGDS